MAKMPLKWTKAAIGAATVGAMMTATPALARHGYDRDDGISAGEVIAGAVILGGLAAIISSDNDRYDGRYNNRYNYRRYGNSRQAINRCVRAAERRGRRYGNLNVTQVTDIDRKRDGYRVRGRVAVRDGYNGRWGRGYDRYDRGKFNCRVRYGRVQVNISHLR